MNSLFQLVLVNFKTFYREPAIIFWSTVFPILMAWVLGIAFSGKNETVRTLYVLGKNAPEHITGEKVYGQDTGNPYRVRFREASEEEAVRAMKRGVIAIYLEVKNDSVLYHFDPSNPDAQLTHLMLERGLAPSGENKSSIKAIETRGTRYIDFLVPGLVALGLMNSCVWGVGWATIEMRMKKLMRRMVATPLKKSVFLGAQGVTRVLLGSIETTILCTFAWLYFGTEITGSLLAFAVVFLSGIIAFSGIGVLIASRTDKAEVANGLVNAVTLSMTILSGVFFNYHNFPDWTIPFIQALPLTLLADAIRAVFIEAAGLKDVLLPVAILCGTGLVTFFAGIKIFKWY